MSVNMLKRENKIVKEGAWKQMAIHVTSLMKIPQNQKLIQGMERQC
jgi:hypothetical protein